MENFFNTNTNLDNSKNLFVNNNSLNSQYDNIKNNYEQIFIEAAESIRREIETFKPKDPCSACSIRIAK